MDKIIIQVYLPADRKVYDIRLPENMYVHDVAEMLAELFSESSKGFYYKCKDNILCFRESGKSLLQDCTLKELGVSNRTQLMFV